MNPKISIRFFADREVRAIWDDEREKWYFSVIDIVSALNGQDDYTKARNYWKYLKNKLNEYYMNGKVRNKILKIMKKS